MIRLAAPLAAAFLAAAPAGAEPLSPWSADGNAAIRLVAGPATGDPRALSAGLEIRLDDGWKTYWKEPGDSGVPPRFDWSGSENLKAVEVLYPAPRRIEAGTAAGYEDDVVLPLRVTPSDPARPVTIRLKLDYAVCGRMCVPALGEASLTRAPDEAIDRFAAASVTRFLGRVPRPARLGDGRPTVSVERAADGALTVAVKGDGAVDLFADGKDSWSPPLPRPEGRDGQGRHLFRLKAGKAPAGAVLALVAVDGENAVEIPVPLH